DGESCLATAWGVYHGIRAVARHALGRRDLTGATVAVQGLGKVGFALARYLADAGADLLVADLRTELVERAVDQLGATAMSVSDILFARADVLAPCALGAILNDETIPRLRCRAIAGAAHNQLAEPRHAEALHRLGIVYAPDYVVSSGGTIAVSREAPGYDHYRALKHCEVIEDVLTNIVERAADADVTPLAVADRLAESRLHHAAAKKVSA